MNALITAFRTLTILPIPGRDTERFSRSLNYFPIVGMALAALFYGLFSLIIKISIQHLPGLLLAGFGIIITGALHVDGLADTADGFGGGKTKDKILDIFKDSRLGTFGVVAVVLEILTKVVLYSHFFSQHLFAPIGASLVLSRMAQSYVLMLTRYAGRDNGTASVFVGEKPNMLSAVISVSILILAGFFWGIFPIVICTFTAICISGSFVWVCYRKLGGVTGDCIGALNEIVEISILLVGLFVYK